MQNSISCCFVDTIFMDCRDAALNYTTGQNVCGTPKFMQISYSKILGNTVFLKAIILVFH